MRSIDETIDRWVEVMMGTTTKKMFGHDYQCNVFAKGDELYSYGEHFVLARAIRNLRGKVVLFLLNGEVRSVSTSRHQRRLRMALERTDFPRVIIPFEVLTEAGITVDRITSQNFKLIDVTPDRWETQVVRSKTWPIGAQKVWKNTVKAGTGGWTKNGEFREGPVGPGWDYLGPIYEQDRSRPYQIISSGYIVWTEEEVDGQIEYVSERKRHHLGESVIEAAVYVRSAGIHRTARFLSGFDMNESQPAYFLCELPPKVKANSVAEAYEALKPEVVKYAESIGREVRRQGDIFAVKMEVTRQDLIELGAKFIKKRSSIWDDDERRFLGTNHKATEIAVLPDGTTFGRGTMRHDPTNRDPDHRPVSLKVGDDDKVWWLFKKNTVPVGKWTSTGRI